MGFGEKELGMVGGIGPRDQLGEQLLRFLVRKWADSLFGERAHYPELPSRFPHHRSRMTAVLTEVASCCRIPHRPQTVVCAGHLFVRSEG